MAKVPDIPGCYTQGRSVAEVLERIKEALHACVKAEDAEPLTFVAVQHVTV